MSSILLPILEMHFCTYVIIGAKGNIETQVATALAPFDESLEVARYKVYLEEAEIKRMAGHYGLDRKDAGLERNARRTRRNRAVFVGDGESRGAVGLV